MRREHKLDVKGAATSNTPDDSICFEKSIFVHSRLKTQSHSLRQCESLTRTEEVYSDTGAGGGINGVCGCSTQLEKQWGAEWRVWEGRGAQFAGETLAKSFVKKTGW